MSLLYYLQENQDFSQIVAAYNLHNIQQQKEQQGIDKIFAFYQEKGSPQINAESQAVNLNDAIPQLLNELVAYENNRQLNESTNSNDYDEKANQRKQSVPWLPSEDEMLKQLAKKYQYKNWSSVAHDLCKEFPSRPRRTCNQCNQRWMRVLNPRITKGKWELEEDKKLANAILLSPPKKWKQIANLMPGRTDIQVRYRIKKISGWLLKQGIPKECLDV